MFDMEAKMARIKAKNPHLIAKNGSVMRTVEKVAFWNDLLDWEKDGKPADGLAKLKAREKELRAAGKF